MTSTSSGYATQVAFRQATWATLRSEKFLMQGRKEMPQDQGITLPTFASLRRVAPVARFGATGVASPQEVTNLADRSQN